MGVSESFAVYACMPTSVLREMIKGGDSASVAGGGFDA
jgi:hypothetical protein